MGANRGCRVYLVVLVAFDLTLNSRCHSASPLSAPARDRYTSTKYVRYIVDSDYCPPTLSFPSLAFRHLRFRRPTRSAAFSSTMASTVVANVVPGFSVTNRWLMYTSLMFTPAQALSGVGSDCPSNIGFLAYNWYQQYTWYAATKAKQLHALSLLPVYLNMLYSLTYLGGIPAGNVFMGAILGLGTAGLVIMNTITAWISLKTNLPEGDGVYQFFFFGWRTLSKGWRIFFLLWEISDTLEAVTAVIGSIAMGIAIPMMVKKKDLGESSFWLWRDTAVFWGSAAVLFVAWPLILWMELLVKRNNIVSETDMVAVYLFGAQVAAMVLPSLVTVGAACCSALSGSSCWPSNRKTVAVLPMTSTKHTHK